MSSVCIYATFTSKFIFLNYLDLKCRSLDFSVNNQLNDEDIVLGGARQLLSKMKSEHQHKEILGIRSSYCAVAQYLINRLPLDNNLVKSLSCLNPVRRFDHSSVADVEILARQLHYDEAIWLYTWLMNGKYTRQKMA